MIPKSTMKLRRRKKVAPPSRAQDLRTVRAMAGLSQEQFAYALPVPLRTLARWESGETEPSPLAEIRVYELKKLFEHAKQVLKKGTVKWWLNRRTDLLNGACPLDVLRRPGGVGQIDAMLGRAEWGISP